MFYLKILYIHWKNFIKDQRYKPETNYMRKKKVEKVMVVGLWGFWNGR